MGGIFDITPEVWAETLRVNLIGPALMVKHAGRAMVDQGRGGAIVLTASVAGLNSGAGPAAYSASKAGVINLAKTAAQQMTTANVRVNAICPGLTETGMTRPTFDYAKEKGVTHEIGQLNRSEEHTSELQSLMRVSYAVFCMKKNTIPISLTSLTNNKLRHQQHRPQRTPNHAAPV